MTQASRKVQVIEGGDKSSPATQPRRQPASALPRRDTQDPIGHVLRRNYDDVVSEAVPERLLSLLEELRRKENE